MQPEEIPEVQVVVVPGRQSWKQELSDKTQTDRQTNGQCSNLCFAPALNEPLQNNYNYSSFDNWEADLTSWMYCITWQKAVSLMRKNYYHGVPMCPWTWNNPDLGCLILLIGQLAYQFQWQDSAACSVIMVATLINKAFVENTKKGSFCGMIVPTS